MVVVVHAVIFVSFSIQIGSGNISSIFLSGASLWADGTNSYINCGRANLYYNLSKKKKKNKQSTVYNKYHTNGSSEN